MSNYEPKEPYIYQPYAPNANNGYLWAIAGIKGRVTEIKGLKRLQAEAILAILKSTDKLTEKYNKNTGKWEYTNKNKQA